ncbi:basic salivary proline-rich protein 3-like, partial [Ochotona curzoniae]|uniref:basic salivary proline-rich protein 3-like n=1 Tax=Ochotona curzoniae TaxID=130825 RepID=UPI001B348924
HSDYHRKLIGQTFEWVVAATEGRSRAGASRRPRERDRRWRPDRPTDRQPAGGCRPSAPREAAAASKQELAETRPAPRAGRHRRAEATTAAGDDGEERRRRDDRRGAARAPPTGLTPPPTTPRPHQPTSPQPGGQRSGAPDTARSPTPRESQPEKPAGETGTTGRLDVATASRPHAPTSAGVAGDGARAREPGPEPRPRPRTTSQPPPHHSPPGWDSGSQARGRWSRGARDSGARDDPLHPGPAGNRQAPAEEERGRRGRGQSPGPRRSPHTHNGGAQPMPSRPYNFATQDGAEEPADRGLRKSPHRPDLTDLNPRAHAPLRQADPPAATPPATAA